MNMELANIEREIAELGDAIRPLNAKMERPQSEKRRLQSRNFIATNKICLADVEMSSGPGIPYFGHISDFAAWLKKNSDKNWAEWNSTIYRMSDLLAGRMPCDMPSSVDDLDA